MGHDSASWRPANSPTILRYTRSELLLAAPRAIGCNTHPFGAPHRVQTAEPLTEDQLSRVLLGRDDGVTLEIVLPSIDAGYLFHILSIGWCYDLRSYAGETLTSLSP